MNKEQIEALEKKNFIPAPNGMICRSAIVTECVAYEDGKWKYVSDMNGNSETGFRKTFDSFEELMAFLR